MAAAAAASSGDLSIKQQVYGKHPSGATVTLWTLDNAAPGGIQVQAIDYGAILVSVLVPDALGVRKDVVLGYDHLEAWVSGKPWFNSIVGRHANRIAEGKFHLDGETFQLERNNLGNNVGYTEHTNGWNSKLMSSSERSGEDAQGKYVGVAMKFHSPDGEDGFPGALDVTTTFRLYADNTLHMDFRAAHPAGSTKPTIVSMCNHAYWNLNGSDGRVGVVDQLLRVKADAITELDGKETMLSTGRIVPVKDGPYDFTSERTIGGQQMEALDKILPAPGGYDVNYVLNKDYQEDSEHPEDTVRSVLASDGTTELRAPFAARLRDPSSGRVMDVYTSAPGIQVYSGNFLDGASLVGRQNVAYPKHAAVCLETQTFPGAITHAEAWRNYPSPVLRPGQVYNHVVQHRFSIAK